MNYLVLEAVKQTLNSYYPKGGVIQPTLTGEWIRSRTLAALAPFSTAWIKEQAEQEGYTQEAPACTLHDLETVSAAEWAEVAKAIG
jgi:hypothetical protein